MGHARFSPSSSYRWINCPGSWSANLVQGPAQESAPNEYMIEGSTAHALLEWCMRLAAEPEDLVGAKLTEHAQVVTDDMATAVGYALDYIYTLQAKHGVSFDEVETESHVSIGPKYDRYLTDEDLSGTLDLSADNGHTLWVIDYKHGAGLRVDAQDNTQLLLYAAGRIRPTHKRVILVVIQPRSWKRTGPVDEWNVRPRDIVKFMNKRALPAIDDAMSPDPTYAAGDWCRWCAIAGSCKARRDMVLAAAADDFSAEEQIMPPTPNEMQPEELARALENADLLEDWIRDVRAHSLTLLLQGERIPGWKLGLSQPHRQWIDPKKVQVAMKRLKFNEDDYMPRSLISPAQAEKLLRAAGIIPRKKRNQPPPKNPLEKLIGTGVPKNVLEKDG